MPSRGITIDVEPTNRCNAKCHFCPRDKTPHQGLMKPEVFEQTLARIVELREVAGSTLDSGFKVSFCGLGEPLLNPKAPSFVREVRDEGFQCVMSSNAAILDEKKGRALLDAGLQQININVGDEGEDYEDVYKLPFERTRENVVRFAEMAGDQCQVNIVIVDYRRDRQHVKHMVKYWQDQGLSDFVFFNVMNRGGALFVDEMEYESYPEREEARALLESEDEVAICGIPFISLFVGYDGQYYLCCSDWVKETPMGSVFDKSFLSVTQTKLQMVTSREPVCKSCNWDPVNQLTDTLRAIKAGEATVADRDSQVEGLLGTTRLVMDALRDAAPLIESATASVSGSGPRKLIPVAAK
jgi:MoaA/NifB/PqqE/SkfB family radical SAM enzyme